MGARGDIRHRQPVDGVERRRVPGSTPGAIAVPSGRSRQSSIRNTSSRSTATGSLSATIRGNRAGRAAPRRRRGAGGRTGRCRHDAMESPGFRWRPRRAGRRAASGSAAGTPSSPCQFSTVGYRQFVLKRDFELVAAPEAQTGVWRRALQRPYRGIRLSRTQGDGCRPGLQRQGRAALGGRDPGHGRTEGRRAQSGQKLAPVQPENSICHEVDADHFPLDMSSRPQVPPGRL